MSRLPMTFGVVTAALLPICGLAGSAGGAPTHHTALANKHAAVHGDLDGDGRADLVVGGPTGMRIRVTYTHAAPGGSHGIWIKPPGAGASGFGWAISTGNFNGDGFADLAVGAPEYHDPDTGDQRGAVFIYRGSGSGLHYTGTRFIGRDTEDDDFEVGDALSAGDIDGDGYDDLAVGDPGPSGGGDEHGSVTVYYGSHSGITASGSQTVVSSKSRDEGAFGAALAMPDVNHDGHRDLVIGEPGGGLRNPTDEFALGEGTVQLIFGSHAGLSHKRQTIHAGSVDAGYENFGAEVAAGDVNGDGFGDVVVGAPFNDKSGFRGKVVVLRGNKSGFSAKRSQTFTAAKLSKGKLKLDEVGLSLVVADVTGDGRSEAVIGAPDTTVAGHTQAGAIVVLRGASTGMTRTGRQVVSQNSPGVPGKASTRGGFGMGLAPFAANRDRFKDIVVGVPGRYISVNKKGMSIVFRGASFGLTTRHIKHYTDPKPKEFFGYGIVR